MQTEKYIPSTIYVHCKYKCILIIIILEGNFSETQTQNLWI